MGRKEDMEMQELIEEMGEEFRERRDEDENFENHRYLTVRWRLIIGGVGIFILIAAFSLFFGGSNNEISSTGDLTAITAKLGQLEQRLTRLENTEQRINRLEDQVKSLNQSISKLGKTVQRISHKGKASVVTKTKPLKAYKKKSTSQAKRRYHEVQGGDTLYRIAKKYNTSVNELRRLNHLKQNQAIYPGQKILLP